MAIVRRRGRPLEWVLNDELIETHKLVSGLKRQHPNAHWADIRFMLETKLTQSGREDLLSKIDRLWGLMKQVIPVPPRCVCDGSSYSYTYKKDEDGHWEILARCTNKDCRYLRRYLPGTSYSWSRPKSLIRELEKIPTFYELDGQKVEGQR